MKDEVLREEFINNVLKAPLRQSLLDNAMVEKEQHKIRCFSCLGISG